MQGRGRFGRVGLRRIHVCPIVIVNGLILRMRRIWRGGSWDCLGRILEWRRQGLEVSGGLGSEGVRADFLSV